MNSALIEYPRIDESAECAAYEAEREAALADTIPCPPPEDAEG